MTSTAARLALLTMTACLATAVHAAARSVLTPAFGATIVSTHPDGRQARLWLNADQTYAAQGRRGQKSGGVWRLKGDRLCLKQRQPTAIPFAYCKALPPVKLGNEWRDQAVNGDAVVNRLVPGRRGAP